MYWVWQLGIFSWSCVATLFAAPLTSRSSLLYVLQCPRLHWCQHWFLSQCFANCSCHWMGFEIQETIIVHTSLSDLSLALPCSSLCAAHLCCTVHQYVAALHYLPKRKPGAPSTRRGAGFCSCHELRLTSNCLHAPHEDLLIDKIRGKSCPEPIWSAYNVEPWSKCLETSGWVSWSVCICCEYTCIHVCISCTSYAPRQLSKASSHTLLRCGVPVCLSVLLWGTCARCPSSSWTVATA